METNVNASVKRACKAVGGQRALAIALGIDAQVRPVVTGRRGVPAKSTPICRTDGRAGFCSGTTPR